MTSLGDFGVDVPEVDESAEVATDTSEDYKFTRPQCQAITQSGDRCLNPTVRGRETDYCPRHEGDQ